MCAQPALDVAVGHYATNKVDKNIIKILSENYSFSQDIILRANNIFLKMKHNNRVKSRNMLLFFCVYNAYIELDIRVIPSELGKIFGLTNGQMQKTQSMFSYLQTGYKPILRKIEILDYIPYYSERLGLSESQCESCYLFAQKMITDHPELKQHVAQTLAAGILLLFLDIYGIVLADKSLLSVTVNRSDTTLSNVYKMLCNYV